MKKTKILLIIVVALFLEIIIFNITSYRTWFGKYDIKKIETPEYMYTSEDKVYLKINDINSEVVTFKIELKGIESPVEYKLFYSDETSKEFFDIASKNYIPSYEKSKYIPLYLSGNTNELIISFNNEIYENGCFNKCVLNEKIPFEFNIIRFIVLLSIFSFGYCMKNLKIFNEEYSEKNLKQEFILLGILTIFLIVLSFINTYSSSEPDAQVNNIFSSISTEEGMYNKEFVDSIKQGKLYLLQEPTERFLKLENPYDAITRSELDRDIDYKWDTAYFNKHFYVYFGILPLLLIFLPYNLLTNCYLKVSIVVFVFSIFILILLKEILLKLLIKYFKKIPFKNVIYFMITILSGTLILYANGMARHYELVIIVGLYFVLQGIYFILKSQETNKNKHLNIFFGSLCLALSVACRPTDLLVSIIILPYLINLLIQYIKNVKENKKNIFKLIISVAIPYISVGIGLMIYNYIRFGNVFDFGNKYQLTINNMMTLGSRFFAIPTGIICNLFKIPNFTPYFPFITHCNDLSTFYGYYYIENMIGGLFMMAPICFFCFYIFKFNKKTENKELKLLVNCLIIIAIIIAILSIMMAGSNQRYLIDYAWMIIFAAILIFCKMYELLKTDEARKILCTFLAIITIYTFIISILAGIISEKNYMRDISPKEYYEMKYTVCFWE